MNTRPAASRACDRARRLWMLLWCCCAPAPAFSAPGTPQGPAIVVDSGTPQPGQSAIASDPAGNFVVAWLQGAGYPKRLVARLYAADGTPRGAVFEIASRYTTPAPPALAMDAGGDFVVAWLAQRPFGDATDHVLARTYAADGTPLGGPLDIGASMAPDNGGFETLHQPVVAMDAAGDWVAVWHQQRVFGVVSEGLGIAFGDSLLARRYTLAGLPRGAARTVARGSGILPRGSYVISPTVQVAMQAGGDYAVAWIEGAARKSGARSEQPSASPFRVRPYRADGTPASLLPITLAVDGYYQNVREDFAFARAANGDYLLAWLNGNDFLDPTRDQIFLRRYGALGAAAGDVIAVASRDYLRSLIYPDAWTLMLASTPDGQLVAWLDAHDAVSYAQYFSAAGEPAGGPFAVGDAEDLHLATDAGGDLLATFGHVLARSFSGR